MTIYNLISSVFSDFIGTDEGTIFVIIEKEIVIGDG